VVKDADIIAEARTAAERLLADDPALLQHPGLTAALERRVGMEERAALAKN
jgi:ATP-dependent DNA helicase RecG